MMLTAAKIEIDWLFIMHLRKKAYRLLVKGEPYTSGKLISIDLRLSRLGNKASKDQHKYEDLCGITEILSKHKKTMA